MKIPVISRQTIKPSSPTPQHHKNHRFSFLDQIAPINVYDPVFFFYLNNSEPKVDHTERSSLLRKSLADCLNSFYPLAGRIREANAADCNDEGVEYLETRVSCNLSEAIKNPDIETWYQLLPFEPSGGSTPFDGKELMAVQFNTFDCGGVAIGVCMSHKIVDAGSVTTFLHHWSSMARGCHDIPQLTKPIFDAAFYFPTREDQQPRKSSMLVNNVSLVTKSFRFDKSNIDILKKNIASSPGSQMKDPSSVEAVSAFIWKRFMWTIRSRSGPTTEICCAGHAVSLRQRLALPPSVHLFGNGSVIVAARASVQSETELHVLVSRIRKSIREIDGDYLKKLKDVESNANPLQELFQQLSDNEMEFICFTSWFRFPLYEVDFGWGKPILACSPRRRSKNLVVLTADREGDGMEAWMTLRKEDMDVLERDPQLLSFASSMN